ncbi:kinase-like domain-containing protein [Jimgerdemannia flammicorona]|uniref:Kinase-like domain-containing protein n=1 Tax=Jimgerdemannia flammicorona TaxID=994334 RepID=A0A433QLD3_9FUNG|nr:kinase-like domain-containing protein [Jimgerdemannia flammicorona]
MSTDLLQSYTALLKPFENLEPHAQTKIRANKLDFPDPENRLASHLDVLDAPQQLADYLSFIPFNRFIEVRRLERGGSIPVLKATAQPSEVGWTSVIMESDDKGDILWNTINHTADSRHHYAPREFILRELNRSMVPEFVLHTYANYPQSTSGSICVYGLTQDEDEKYYMVTDYASHGNLDTVARGLSKNVSWLAPPSTLPTPQDLFKNVSWHHITLAARLIAKELAKLHQLDIVHNNIHPGNVVFGLDVSVGIVDLRLSRAIIESHKEPGVYGRLEYFPPEVFAGEPLTKASDVYCLGSLMWQLVTGVPPRSTAPRAIHEHKNKMREESIPGAYQPYMEIVHACWNPDPEKRPSALEVDEQLEEMAKKEIGPSISWLVKAFILRRRVLHKRETKRKSRGTGASESEAVAEGTSKFYPYTELRLHGVYSETAVRLLAAVEDVTAQTGVFGERHDTTRTSVHAMPHGQAMTDPDHGMTQEE